LVQFLSLGGLGSSDGLETWSRSRDVSRDPFKSLGLEGRRSCVGLEGFRSRAIRFETLHRLLFMKFCKEFLKKNGFEK